MASVSVQARKVERRLRERLPGVRNLEAHHESKRWHLSWSDGPTYATMRALLQEEEFTRLAPGLPPDAWDLSRVEQPAAVAVRLVTLAREGNLPAFPDYAVRWAAEEAARGTDYPEHTDDPLTAAMAARLLDAAGGSEAAMGELVTARGIAWLHPGQQGETDPADPRQAVEILTVRYASGAEETAWRRSLTPLSARDAVLRALADPDAGKEELLAAHALLPVLRAELDDAETRLMRRARDEGATWPELGRARGTSEQAAQQLYQRRMNTSG